MSMIMVTGATGGLGKAVIEHLLKRVPAQQIVGLARDPVKATELIEQGVDIRQGNYEDAASLNNAFAGIDKLFLVSAVAFSDRFAQHLNVINAAKASGVRHIFYTTIQRNASVEAPILHATDSDVRTEAALRASGLDYTIVRHPLYLDALPMFIGTDFTHGMTTSAGSGRIALTLRDELAQGAAALLVSSGPVIPEILLNAGTLVTLEDVAHTLQHIVAAEVRLTHLSHDAWVATKVAEGLPAPVAEFFASWYAAIRLGAFDEASDDLARLIGREPTRLEPALRSVFGLN